LTAQQFPDSDITVASVGEHALIERVRQRAASSADWVLLGIGDDAAVLRPARGAVDVVTTDAMVEGVHFRRDWTAPRAIGHKSLAVNLSDLAAMGARPRAVLLSLVLPADFPLRDFDELIDGVVTLANAAHAPLVGGNIARSPGPLVVDVTALGTAHPRRLLTRGGGRPGDELFLTGTVGAAAAGLSMLQEGEERSSLSPEAAACVARYEQPSPRTRIGERVAGAKAASACVDLSDGLADAVRQLAAASRCGVVLDGEHIPVDEGAAAWARRRGQSPVDFTLAGGEDYELLFAVPRQRLSAFRAVGRREQNVPLTRVGRLAPEPGCWLERDGRREPLGRGFAHF